MSGYLKNCMDAYTKYIFPVTTSIYWKLKFRHVLCNLHTVHICIATGCITSDGITNIYKNNGMVT